jgi:hypothetical protein
MNRAEYQAARLAYRAAVYADRKAERARLADDHSPYRDRWAPVRFWPVMDAQRAVLDALPQIVRRALRSRPVDPDPRSRHLRALSTAQFERSRNERMIRDAMRKIDEHNEIRAMEAV